MLRVAQGPPRAPRAAASVAATASLSLSLHGPIMMAASAVSSRVATRKLSARRPSKRQASVLLSVSSHVQLLCTLDLRLGRVCRCASLARRL